MAKKGTAATRTLVMELAPALRALPAASVFWLVKVSGLYLTLALGLAGHPGAGHPHTDLDKAWEVARDVRRRRLYLGRVHVVRRRHVRPAQW